MTTTTTIITTITTLFSEWLLVTIQLLKLMKIINLWH